MAVGTVVGVAVGVGVATDVGCEGVDAGVIVKVEMTDGAGAVGLAAVGLTVDVGIDGVDTGTRVEWSSFTQPARRIPDEKDSVITNNILFQDRFE